MLPYSDARFRTSIPAEEVKPMENTGRRMRICQFIARFRDEHGYAPTVRQIGRGVGITSTSVVQYYILRLERAGILKRDPFVSRGLVLRPDFLSTLRLPVSREAARNRARK